MSTPLTSGVGSLFIQVHPDEDPEYFDCADLGDISAPAGDVTLINCRQRDRTVKTIGSTQGTPGAVTTTITALINAESDVLDDIENCDVSIFAGSGLCGRNGIFANYDRMLILHHARISSRAWQKVIEREADNPQMRVLNVSAWNPVYEARKVAAVQQTIAETLDLNDIVFDMDARCAGECGAAKDLEDEGYIVTDGTSASPPSDADVWQTTTAGGTWASVTAGAATPFAGGDIISGVRFQVDRDNWRLLVVSGPKAGSFQCAYSDDDGTTWTNVTIGSTAWEGAMAADALFALDKDHVWVGTSAGNVYFSSDGGQSWTVESSAITASDANPLNAVKFADHLNGYAAGNNDTLIKTTDGGTNWSELTPPTSSDHVTSLAVLSKNMLLVGSNADGLWKSLDAGVTWTSITFTGQGTTGTVKGIDFAPNNELCGWMIHNTSAPLGSVHRTMDGGINWEKITTPTNAGLNAVAAIDVNTCYAVGNTYGGTGFVVKVSPS